MSIIRPAPAWPDTISSQNDLLKNLCSDSNAVHSCTYGVDFFPPYYGETAYVDGSGRNFTAVLFGVVVSPVVGSVPPRLLVLIHAVLLG
jgi:hypothetical protein